MHNDLIDMTGLIDLPLIYINGNLFGGSDDLHRSIASLQFGDILNAAYITHVFD